MRPGPLGAMRTRRVVPVSADGPIRGQVARVLNTREIVINRGSARNVERGMIFAVLDVSGADITDPETGEVLGSVERTKVLVKVIEVNEKFCVAKTFTYRTVGGAYSGLTGVAGLFEPRRRVYDTLEIDDSTAAELDEQDSYVKVGDPVKESEYEE